VQDVFSGLILLFLFTCVATVLFSNGAPILFFPLYPLYVIKKTPPPSRPRTPPLAPSSNWTLRQTVEGDPPAYSV